MPKYCQVCQGSSMYLRYSMCRSCQSFYYRVLREVMKLTDKHCDGHCLDTVRCVDTGSRKYRFICKSCRFTKCQQLIANCDENLETRKSRGSTDAEEVKEEENVTLSTEIDIKAGNDSLQYSPNMYDAEGDKITVMAEAFDLLTKNMRNVPKFKMVLPTSFLMGSDEIKDSINFQTAQLLGYSAKSALIFLKQIPEFNLLSLKDRALLFPTIAFRLFSVTDLLVGIGDKFNCNEAFISSIFSVYPLAEGLVVSRYIAKQSTTEWNPLKAEIVAFLYCLLFHRTLDNFPVILFIYNHLPFFVSRNRFI